MRNQKSIFKSIVPNQWTIIFFSFRFSYFSSITAILSAIQRISTSSSFYFFETERQGFSDMGKGDLTSSWITKLFVKYNSFKTPPHPPPHQTKNKKKFCVRHFYRTLYLLLHFFLFFPCQRELNRTQPINK